MRLNPYLVALASVLLACGGSKTSSSGNDSGAPKDAGQTAPDTSAPDVTVEADAADSGPDRTTLCEEGDATPASDCGTLAFTKSPVASRPRNHHVTLIAPTGSGNLLYAIAGVNADLPIDNVDIVPIEADGSLGKWVVGRPIPVPTGGHVGGFVSGVLVIAGGNTGTITDLSYSSVLNPDGSLGPWKVQDSVGHPRMHAGSFTKGDTMWVLGGFNDQSVWSDIVSATVEPDGTVSSWKPAGSLPGPRSHFSLTLVDDYVYITGGLDMSAYDDPPDLQDAWRGQIQADGTVGAWTKLTDLPVAEATHASFFYGGYLYVCGGINNVPEQEDRCWSAPVEADHSLGKFEEVASLLIARGHVHQLPVLGGMVYSIAGAIDFNLNSTTEIDIGSFELGPMKKGRIAPRRAHAPIPGNKRHDMGKCHMLHDRG